MMLQRSVKGTELVGNAVGFYMEEREKDVSGKQTSVHITDSAVELVGQYRYLKK